MSSSTCPPFPTYLLPSLGFGGPTSHRRQSSLRSIASSSSLHSNIFSLDSTPSSSLNTTPSSSPPDPNYLVNHPASFIFDDRDGEEAMDMAQERQRTSVSSRQGDEAATTLSRVHPDTLKCSTCATDIAFSSQIVSKGFTGRHGRAYLVSPPPPTSSSSRKPPAPKAKTPHPKINAREDEAANLLNTKVGKPVSRQLVTGAHVVADISCTVCGEILGWKYVDAREASQRYKIGKFILETKKVVRGVGWEDVELRSFDFGILGEPMEGSGEGRGGAGEVDTQEGEGGDEITFDSGDEDECEELFAGTWDRETVRKRRAKRVDSRKRVGVVEVRAEP